MNIFVNWVFSPVAQSVKNLPAMQETWVQSLSWDDPLEKGIATHSSIFLLENTLAVWLKHSFLGRQKFEQFGLDAHH